MPERLRVEARRVLTGDIVRYSKGASPLEVDLDGFLNFHFLTQAPIPGYKRLLLEAGINRIAEVETPSGARRPAILLRSSPWKSGQETNPWEDVFDLDHGHVRYYGDHKPTTVGGVGATAGNRALLAAWNLHGSSGRTDRLAAPPLLLFRAVPVQVDSRTVNKGYLDFCGVGVIERLELTIQRDPQGTGTFPNLVVDLVVVDLCDADDGLDWRWIDDRRNPELSDEQTLRYAPAAWKKWVNNGRVSLPTIRRRVLSSRVKSAAEQRPAPGSKGEQTLDRIYRHFDDQKHRFEQLAAAVAAHIFEKSGSRYHRGWLTKAGGDGGMDFVGRLDAGAAGADTPLVVLGQAKCIAPSSSISPDQVARVVARLRRGWIGVFVTTGVFSKQAQVEVIDDEYPIILVPAAELVRAVTELAELSHQGDVDALLQSVAGEYEAHVTYRRPEEILAEA